MIPSSHIQETQESSSRGNMIPDVYEVKHYRGSNWIQTLVNAIIRPSRFMYNERLLLLPPQEFQTNFTYHQYSIPFKLSLYKAKDMKYVVLYLHGNASSRYEGFLHLKQLPTEVGLACFDFKGCGMRFQSQYITLGKNQSEEVDIAVRFLKSQGYTVIGWGRSMGAVSLLLSQECDIMIADSPFHSLEELCRFTSQKILPSPICCLHKCIFPCLMQFVGHKIFQKSGLKIKDLEISRILNNPKNRSKKLFIMAAKQDQIIPFEHSQIIYDVFPGEKKIRLFQGTHDSSRPENVIKSCFFYIQKWLGLTHHQDFSEAEMQFKTCRKISSAVCSNLSEQKLMVSQDNQIIQENKRPNTPRNSIFNNNGEILQTQFELSLDFQEKMYHLKSEQSQFSQPKSPVKLIKAKQLGSQGSKDIYFFNQRKLNFELKERNENRDSCQEIKDDRIQVQERKPSKMVKIESLQEQEQVETPKAEYILSQVEKVDTKVLSKDSFTLH